MSGQLERNGRTAHWCSTNSRMWFSFRLRTQHPRVRFLVSRIGKWRIVHWRVVVDGYGQVQGRGSWPGTSGYVDAPYLLFAVSTSSRNTGIRKAATLWSANGIELTGYTKTASRSHQVLDHSRIISSYTYLRRIPALKQIHALSRRL
jgi:hypothetical protein